MHYKRGNSQHGFNIIELMISVLVLGAIITGALTYIKDIADDYATVRRESLLRTLNRSLANKLDCARTFPDPYNLCRTNTQVHTRQRNNKILTAVGGTKIGDDFKVTAVCRSDGRINAVEFMYYNQQQKKYMSTSRGIPVGCQATLPCRWNDKNHTERIGGKYYRRRMLYYSSGGYLRRTAEGGGFHGIPGSSGSWWTVYNYISGKGNSFYIRIHKASCTVAGPITARADPNGCLHKDTMILTEGGNQVPISRLAPESRIYNPNSGTFENFEHLTQGYEKYLYEIEGEGFSVKATSTHPVLTPDGLVAAEDLQPGHTVVDANGNHISITRIQKILYDDEVWNIVMNRSESNQEKTFVADGIVVGDGIEQKKLNALPDAAEPEER